jgi:hypothetical protein
MEVSPEKSVTLELLAQDPVRCKNHCGYEMFTKRKGF